ncbi:MAG: hypothetical protein HQ522_06510 [Bacteroidetes bacterium]|nr:hypothetical protein [Bacteroidota bacterium]
MRVYTKKQQEEISTETNIYDAFVQHLDSIYFPGASEVLNTELIVFEYDSYKESYA